MKMHFNYDSMRITTSVCVHQFIVMLKHLCCTQLTLFHLTISHLDFDWYSLLMLIFNDTLNLYKFPIITLLVKIMINFIFYNNTKKNNFIVLRKKNNFIVLRNFSRTNCRWIVHRTCIHLAVFFMFVSLDLWCIKIGLSML